MTTDERNALNSAIASGDVQGRPPLTETEQIKAAVQEHYSKVADRGTEAGCCGPEATADDCCGTAANGLYDLDEIAAIPAEAAAASAGCGNPTAISDLKPGETVVDLGSGGGIDCFLASKMVGETGKVIGIDMTIKMVELARENARKLEAHNVEFKLAPIEAIPIPDGQVDAVISNCVLALVPDKPRVFAEAFRVLKPGGRIFISDMVTIGDLPPEVVQDAAQWVSCVGGAEDRDKYLQQIVDAGFEAPETISEVALSSGEGTTWAGSVYSLSLKAVKPA
ncbi:MAG: arsenite methyltransferase [Chloroflexi bacterium]|nr:arsenite methyltransferase [Chloroflexota bacterium]